MPDNQHPKRPTIDERLDAIRKALELAAAKRLDGRETGSEKRFKELPGEIAKVQEETSERIRALLSIAEAREHRRPPTEDQQQ